MSTRPTLVYGIVGGLNLVLLREDVAMAVADDLEAIYRFAAYGAARRFEPRYLLVPGIDDEHLFDGDMKGLDQEELNALREDGLHFEDDRYDPEETQAFRNGDWPPRAATLALDCLPEDLDDSDRKLSNSLQRRHCRSIPPPRATSSKSCVTVAFV